MTGNPFRTTDDQIREAMAAVPESERGMFQQMLDARANLVHRLNDRAAARRFTEALALVGSEERAQHIAAWDEQFKFTDDEARQIITEWWTSTEAWSGDPFLRGTMMGLLERVAPIVSIDHNNPRPLPDILELTVYRGNLGERPDAGSWTLDATVAERFARMANSPRGMYLGMYREDGVPTVWRGRVDRDRILGYFDDRGEQEVVLPAGAARSIERFSWREANSYGIGRTAAEAAASIDAPPKATDSGS